MDAAVRAVPAVLEAQEEMAELQNIPEKAVMAVLEELEDKAEMVVLAGTL